MESLRWVLLFAGIAFVLVIYFIGRSRRQRNHSMVDELEDSTDDGLPEFSAQSLDDVDEGVGRVRVISRTHGSDVLMDEVTSIRASHEDPDMDDEQVISENQDSKNAPDSADKQAPSDIIVIYILPKPEKKLPGSEINSAAQAMGMRFGEMNIFHYNRGDRNIFSLANMLEPGSFDPETIHELKTSGLTVFLQLQKGDPLDDLTEMLQRSYQLAGLLDAVLCNHRRTALTEQDAENYRAQVRAFIEYHSVKISGET